MNTNFLEEFHILLLWFLAYKSHMKVKMWESLREPRRAQLQKNTYRCPRKARNDQHTQHMFNKPKSPWKAATNYSFLQILQLMRIQS